MAVISDRFYGPVLFHGCSVPRPKLRIPEWAEGSTLKVNGKDAGVEVIPGTYATVNRQWQKGDVKAEYKSDLLGGVTAITGTVALRQDKKGGMYRKLTEPKWNHVKTQFVPYYSWCNREESEMTVFLPLIWK